MDLGIFQTQRWSMGVWIAVPLLLIAAASATTTMMRSAARQALAQREALLSELPDLEQRVERANALLQRVTATSARQGEKIQDATKRLDESAARAGLTIRMLKVVDGVESKGAYRVATFQVQAEGSLKALVLWLDQVQKPGLLMSIRSASINSNIPITTGLYSADLTIELRLRAS